MFSPRLLAIAAAAFALVAGQSEPPQSPSRYILDDVDPGWTYSAGATRVEDHSGNAWFDGYTLLPAGGSAIAKFSGSGIAVWLVLPPSPAGSLKFYLDDLLLLTFGLDRASNDTSYDVKAFSSHNHPIKDHTLKVVSDTLVYAIDTAIYNPGPPSPDDPDDD